MMAASLRQCSGERLQRSHWRTQGPGQSIQEGGSGKPYPQGARLQRDSRTILRTKPAWARPSFWLPAISLGLPPSGYSVSEQQVMFLGYFHDFRTLLIAFPSPMTV